eukprot:5573577-Amphidinium_carterae.1
MADMPIPSDCTSNFKVSTALGSHEQATSIRNLDDACRAGHNHVEPRPVLQHNSVLLLGPWGCRPPRGLF